jgi:hypothetical protein
MDVLEEDRPSERPWLRARPRRVMQLWALARP